MRVGYHANMARKREDGRAPGTDWYLPEWMDTLRITQAQVCRETGWSKATVNDIYHGKTAYYRQIVNDLARALRIEPFELLLPPEEAMQIRRLRTAVEEEGRLRAVAEARREFTPAPPEDVVRRAG